MSDEKAQDERAICAPWRDPNWDTITELGGVPNQLRQEIEHPCSIYKQLEGKPADVYGWRAREEALARIVGSPCALWGWTARSAGKDPFSDPRERARARPRFALWAGLTGVFLLVAGFVLTGSRGALHELAVIAVGYGIGATVVAVFLALGFDPGARK